MRIPNPLRRTHLTFRTPPFKIDKKNVFFSILGSPKRNNLISVKSLQRMKKKPEGDIGWKITNFERIKGGMMEIKVSSFFRVDCSLLGWCCYSAYSTSRASIKTGWEWTKNLFLFRASSFYFERRVATIFLEDYEVKQRLYFSFLIALWMTAGSFLAAYVVIYGTFSHSSSNPSFADLIHWIILIIVTVVQSAWIAYRFWSLENYNNKFLKNLNRGRTQGRYSLSIRYQLVENLRVMKVSPSFPCVERRILSRSLNGWNSNFS